MSERKRAKAFLGDGYYNELLGLAEGLPTKVPPEEVQSAAEDSHLVELMDALRAANLDDNDVPLFTLLRERGFGKVETYLLISLMVRRKKGRGRPEKESILKLQARALRTCEPDWLRRELCNLTMPLGAHGARTGMG